ncbi:MAG: fumarylacetoacetate hydrolase family protein [Bdellovibrionaceae bacterium]|nr:fumarylacetoacetate hydrolase family protein [Pseudobdellovibrionaceae bacterium]
MKLGSLKDANKKDGRLVLVSKDLKNYVDAADISPSLLQAIENWNQVEPKLKDRYQQLNSGSLKDAKPYSESLMAAALPRTWLFADGSSFIYHVKLVRKARKAPLPETLQTVPLMYQGEAGRFLAPTEAIPQVDFSHGTDFEGEVGVIVDDVPIGVTAEVALKHIKLVVLINDVSLRGLIPEELASGFGFFQSKPNSALSPLALTVDEFGSAWKEGRLHLPLTVNLNGQFFGIANAGEMYFHFGQLIAHAAKTRPLAAGSLIGSGTVSNEDHAKGSSCLVEKRTIEVIEKEKAETPFMKVGDTIEILMKNEKGEDLFGRIFQTVQKA